ncbi:MAG: hypothetical protein R3E83_14730 [Burkholderiaceae bacterium]
MTQVTGRTAAILATLVTTWVSSGAFAAEGAAGAAAPMPDRARWQLLDPAADGSVELVARDRAGALAAVCQDGECGVFVEPLDGCIPGSQYPLLVNSAKQVGVIASTCGVLSASGSERYVVKLEPQNALFPAMMNGDDISIAFPTQDGEMNVIYISMAGVREHLAKLLPLSGDEAAADQARAAPAPSRAPQAGAEAAPRPQEQARAPQRAPDRASRGAPGQARVPAPPSVPDQASAPEARPSKPKAPEAAPQSPRFLVPERNHFQGPLTAT